MSLKFLFVKITSQQYWQALQEGNAPLPSLGKVWLSLWTVRLLWFLKLHLLSNLLHFSSEILARFEDTLSPHHKPQNNWSMPLYHLAWT